MFKLVFKSYFFRLYPNKETEEMFFKNLGCCRFVYNKILEQQQDYNVRDKICPVILGKNYYYRRLTELKQFNSFLYVVDSTSLQATCENLYSAFINFFKHGRGFPRFKSRKNPVQSFKLKVNRKTNSIRIEGNSIRLNRYGFVQFKDNRNIEGLIFSATITYKNGKWYCALNCADVPVKPFKKTGNNIGIDLGIKSFLTTSEGSVITKPNISELEEKLKKLQIKLSRQVKGSNRWLKTLKKMYKIIDRITNIQDDFFHKLSYVIVKKFDIISVETLQIKKMLQNKHLSHGIHSQSWYKFLTFLKYKCEWYDKEFVRVNTFFPSSKLCNVCGYKYKDLTLDIREWTCPECNTTHDRDINASKNILNQGLTLLNRRCDGDSTIN